MQAHLARVSILLGLLCPLMSGAVCVVELNPQAGDMTPVVRRALEATDDPDVRLVLARGRYHFFPDHAHEAYGRITNHDNGPKRIAFPFEGMRSVEVEGNGAELVFHGRMLPFLFENCLRVSVRDFSIDWDVPFDFEGEVVAVDETAGWRDVRPCEGFSWCIGKGRFVFPDIDGFSYGQVGSTLAFDPETGEVAHGAWDFTSKPSLVEERPNGILRFHEKLKHWPRVGEILNSKGSVNRYAPAVYGKSSANLRFENIVVHHALGMGFLMERCDTVAIKGGGVFPRADSGRMVSTLADGTHFANCKGDVLVEGMRFKGMLDDSTNVHGTYVVVDGIPGEKTVRVELKHDQQLGFEFAGIGDEVWFIHQPDPSRAEVDAVAGVSVVDDRFIELTFKNPLPENLGKGDVLENKTWNPTFTLRGCRFERHRARNIVLKTPLPIMIENCDFASHMSAVFFRGETYYWYESGAVQDVLIRNNRFRDCASSGMEHAVLRITPRLGKTFDETIPYDRNIRFIDNVIETFDNRIVWADRVDGLVVKGNTIKQTHTFKPMREGAYLFDFTNCRHVQVVGNTYVGTHGKAVAADDATRPTLVIEDNKGF